MTDKTPNRKYPVMPDDSAQLWKIYNNMIDLADADVQSIVDYLELAPNILTFNIGADPSWIVVDGNVPISQVNASGPSPPTVINGDTIQINETGIYDITCFVGVNVGSGNNDVAFQFNVDGSPTGVTAGAVFEGGQAAPAIQSSLGIYNQFSAGTLITIVATETGTDTKILLWDYSGGAATLAQHEFGGGGAQGTGLPAGGTTGQLLVKLSPADGDATWEDLVLDGGDANG